MVYGGKRGGKRRVIGLVGVREGIPVYINGLLEVLSGIMGVTEGTSGF